MPYWLSVTLVVLGIWVIVSLLITTQYVMFRRNQQRVEADLAWVRKLIERLEDDGK